MQVLLPARYLTSESKSIKQRRLWGARCHQRTRCAVCWHALGLNACHTTAHAAHHSRLLTLATSPCAGTDMYTDDSDLVAVLVHTGHVKLKAAAPKTPLLVSLRASAAQSSYSSSERHGLKSRKFGEGHAGVSYKIERCLQHTAGAVPEPELSLLRPGPSRQMPASLLPQVCSWVAVEDS